MAQFVYLFRGDTPKLFGDTKLAEPGATLEFDAPQHNGQLEPISAAAKKYAEENELVLSEYAPWQRPAAPEASPKKSKVAEKPKESKDAAV